MSKPPRSPSKHYSSEIVTDPVEIAASEERSRQYRRTAAGQIGTSTVIDAPLPLLAQFIAELPVEDRHAFLAELTARLPADALGPLADAVRARIEAA